VIISRLFFYADIRYSKRAREVSKHDYLVLHAIMRFPRATIWGQNSQIFAKFSAMDV
jgi:hypothetical protein